MSKDVEFYCSKDSICEALTSMPDEPGCYTCPACGYPKAFSVSKKNGRILFHCFACHDQKAVLEALKARGHWPRSGHSTPRKWPPRPAMIRPETENRRLHAQRLWERSLPALGSPVEAYLRSRGLTGPIPADLRYLPSHRHRETGRRMPVMLAAVRHEHAGLVAVHRTFLAPDGQAKAEVTPAKKTLGPTAGGAARLAPAGELLLIGEGIETSLSAQLATGLPAWAALGTAGLTNLELPPHVREVIILADADPPGLAAAHSAAKRWLAQGRAVRVACPPAGKDFNDLLREGGDEC